MLDAWQLPADSLPSKHLPTTMSLFSLRSGNRTVAPQRKMRSAISCVHASKTGQRRLSPERYACGHTFPKLASSAIQGRAQCANDQGHKKLHHKSHTTTDMDFMEPKNMSFGKFGVPLDGRSPKTKQSWFTHLHFLSLTLKEKRSQTDPKRTDRSSHRSISIHHMTHDS